MVLEYFLLITHCEMYRDIECALYTVPVFSAYLGMYLVLSAIHYM